MKMKAYALLLLAAILLTMLVACSISPIETAEHQTAQVTQPTSQIMPQPTSQPTPQPMPLPAPSADEAIADESAGTETAEETWKTALAEDLFTKYGVLPEYYEDLGNGIYQVFVEVGGKIVPFFRFCQP